jgi:hypothetical protein
MIFIRGGDGVRLSGEGGEGDGGHVEGFTLGFPWVVLLELEAFQVAVHYLKGGKGEGEV